MRAALWLVALFGVAVAVALFAGNNQAVVTLFWPPHRVDMSFNLVIVLLAAFFVLLHVALRALSAVFSLPLQARRWRAQQKERAMYAALMDSLAHLMAGRYIRASRSAENALLQQKTLSQLASEGGLDTGYNPSRTLQLRALAHLLVAEGAHALQNKTTRQSHLEQAMEHSAKGLALETLEGAQLSGARWALNDRDANAALTWLNQLPQGAARRTLALRMKLRATKLAGQTLQSLETARLLAKHRAFSKPAAQSIVRGLALELLNGAHDPEQLQQAWRSLDTAEQGLPEVAVHAAARVVALGGQPQLALQWLANAWDDVMQPRVESSDSLRVKYVEVLEKCLPAIDAAWLARIETGLQARPRDASLQYLAGMACLNRQLWGKAQQLLSHAVLALKDPALRRGAWRALAELATKRGDEGAANQAYRHAAEA